MRKFYIFKINDEFYSLTKNCPYNLYKSLEQIYRINKTNLNEAYNLFSSLCLPFDQNKLNINIFNKYKDNESYVKFNNVHMINDYFSKESSKLTINKTHLTLTTSKANPIYFDNLKNIKGIFVCDFNNVDYFYLENICLK